MNTSINLLFLELFWPATAGNVAWSFFTVIVNRGWCSSGSPARLLVLFFLAWYLATSWMRLRFSDSNNEGNAANTLYWLADAFHLTSIIVFSIAAVDPQKSINWLTCSLEAIFFISIIGHLIGAWVPDNKNHWHERFLLAGANLLGLSVILVSPVLLLTSKLGEDFILPVALVTTLAAWYAARKFLENRKFYAGEV